MSAWVKQLAKQVEKHGTKIASWYCVWDEPTGGRRMKSHGPGREGKRLAQLHAEQLGAKLALNQYDEFKRTQTTWGEFVGRYDHRVLKSLATGSRKESLTSLRHFARILGLDGKPLSVITTEQVAHFTSVRREERGKQPGSKLSPASLNKDLRAIKAAIRQAHEWELLDKLPKFRFTREPQKLPTFVRPDHFTEIYRACETASRPVGFHNPAAWWRELLMFAYLTGWRIGEILSLTWADVDLDEGLALTRAEDNKGKRDGLIRLHPAIIEHITPLKAFDDRVFPWDADQKALYREFDAIQKSAGIDARYTFHDLRRAFATLNALNMSEQALQNLMRHASPLTTKRYVNVAEQLKPALATLYVPDVG